MALGWMSAKRHVFIWLRYRYSSITCIMVSAICAVSVRSSVSIAVSATSSFSPPIFAASFARRASWLRFVPKS
jgi:hypothetical protein